MISREQLHAVAQRLGPNFYLSQHGAIRQIRPGKQELTLTEGELLLAILRRAVEEGRYHHILAGMILQGAKPDPLYWAVNEFISPSRVAIT